MKKTALILLIIPFITCTKAEPSEEQIQKPWYKRFASWLTTEKVTLSTMNYEQLLAAKQRAIDNNDRFTAIKYLERMSKVCADLETLRGILLELANLLFDDGKFAKAYLLYDQYVKSYPGQTKDYSHAYYRKVLCSYYQVLDVDRDQTITEQTLELCDSFLKDCKGSAYEEDVQTIIVSCRKKLAQHELYVAQHYIIQNRVVSANRRIAHIRDIYLHVPDVEYQVLNLEVTLAEKVGNTQFAQQRKQELVEKFPQAPSMVVTQAKEPRTNMARRF